MQIIGTILPDEIHAVYPDKFKCESNDTLLIGIHNVYEMSTTATTATTTNTTKSSSSWRKKWLTKKAKATRPRSAAKEKSASNEELLITAGAPAKVAARPKKATKKFSRVKKLLTITKSKAADRKTPIVKKSRFWWCCRKVLWCVCHCSPFFKYNLVMRD